VTEHEIVKRCRQGDREAQRELYARTSDRIYRLLLRMTRNPDDAFDLAQDTYLRAFERIHQFDGQAKVATWVYRVAVNEALQFLRRRQRRDRAMEERVSPASPGGVDEASARDARLDVEAAIDRLPEDERALIVLRHFEGLGYAEMARVLDKPPGTIASGLSRARRMLRDLLGPGFETAG
jgi:RNA polymerase sigma-70 factor (ECF subfamily)